MDNNKDIFVTEPILPPLEDCMPMIRQIWNSKQLTNHGPLVKQFEESLKSYLGAKHLSVVNNATTGLMIAQKALNFRGEVITTPFSFVATAHSINWLGLKPIFVDTDKNHGNLDPEKVEGAINKQTGGILACHNFGFPSEVEKLAEISKKYKIPLIFDGAPAVGVRYKEKSITEYGDACILSFHATKIFTTLEGGAVISRSQETKDRIDQFRNFNIRNEQEVGGPGVNGKMNELQAAIGLAGIANIDDTIQSRKNRYGSYKSALRGCEKIVIPEIRDHWNYNYSYFPIFFSEGLQTREKVFEDLQREGIHCRKYWYPLINKHALYLQDELEVPVAQGLSESVLALPMGNDVSLSTIDLISRSIRKTVNG